MQESSNESQVNKEIEFKPEEEGYELTEKELELVGVNNDERLEEYLTDGDLKYIDENAQDEKDARRLKFELALKRVHEMQETNEIKQKVQRAIPILKDIYSLKKSLTLNYEKIVEDIVNKVHYLCHDDYMKETNVEQTYGVHYPKSGKIFVWFDNLKSNHVAKTAIHEILHEVSTNRNFFKIISGFRTKEKYIGINECQTELLTENIAKSINISLEECMCGYTNSAIYYREILNMLDPGYNKSTIFYVNICFLD